jgi:hypothetical protein
MWGGWGPPDPAGAAAVVGGWVADEQAVAARLIAPEGRASEDQVSAGVAIFLWTDEFRGHEAQVELLDAEGHVTRSGPLYRM